jgi:leucyl/phenylalanyl-tRNA---protein transferase
MPVYQLTDALLFPDPTQANPRGLLAVGGDLGVERLLLAYRLGIFPWYGLGEPVLWWSPPKRCIVEPTRFHASRSLQRIVKQGRFSITFDEAFSQVIRACAETRLTQGEGTWITPEMIDAYCALHEVGFAHSVEAWWEGQLAGGIYGVSLGRAFFGESMFTQVTNGSKVAFFSLAQRLAEWEFSFIDCQITNPHLMRLGAYEITRREFLRRLNESLQFSTRRGQWR